MKDFKIVFIHGWTGSSSSDWFPNIARKLYDLSIDYAIPDLPGGKHSHAAEWLDTLHKIISTTDKPLVLVGHSLGTRAALLYLEKYQPKVEKVFLIAAFANRIENAERKNKAYQDFFENKIDIDNIKPLVGEFIVMHSKNDPSIAYEQAVEIAKDLDAKLVSYEDRGHFIDNPKDAEIILEELREEQGF